jgi:cobalt/nickel transport protein
MRYLLEVLTCAAVIVLGALFLASNAGGAHEWSGADAQAEEAILEQTGGTYEPWFSPFFEPPSGEIESLLFSLQAAMGALVIGYCFGYWQGHRSTGTSSTPTAGSSSAPNEVGP